MKNVTAYIRQMRSDVDSLARGKLQPPAPGPAVFYSGQARKWITLREPAGRARITFEHIHPGERVTRRDFFCDEQGQLCRVRLPWWQRTRALGDKNEFTYYRIV